MGHLDGGRGRVHRAGDVLGDSGHPGSDCPARTGGIAGDRVERGNRSVDSGYHVPAESTSSEFGVESCPRNPVAAAAQNDAEPQAIASIASAVGGVCVAHLSRDSTTNTGCPLLLVSV